MTRNGDIHPWLLQWSASFFFSGLFALHTLLAAFGVELSPSSFLAKCMFRVGRAIGTPELSAVRPNVVYDVHAVPKHVPAVMRGFFPRVSLSDLVACAGPDAVVPTHRYEHDHVIRELCSLQNLAECILAGESTNAKAVTFPNARDFPIFAGLYQKVDALRGTEGMPWNELAMQFFIGGVGTYTRCHADPSMNCYLQLCGGKRWKIAPPGAITDLSVLPRGRNISYHAHRDHNTIRDWIVVDLQAGDLLVLPPFWFHEVTNIPVDKDGDQDDDNGQAIVGLAMNWLSGELAWRQSKLMTFGSMVLQPRLWPRLLSFTGKSPTSVDEEIMRACRQVCSCSVGPAHEKMAVIKKFG